jgi:catechol 2,3-dioxygenase-like lactoylglutathione lyase family enzyme
MQGQVKPPFSTVRGGFIALTVSDLDATADWYCRKLGLRVVKKHVIRPDNKAAVTVLQGNGLAVELIWFADAIPLSNVDAQLTGAQQVHGILKSGVFVDDLDRTFEVLKSRNVSFAFDIFHDKSMECRMFAIRDNNGNIIQFLGE